MKHKFIITVLTTLLSFGNSSYAASTFTDRVSFNNELSNSSISDVRVLDFESSSPGDLLPSGNSLGGITFTYAIDGINMKVDNQFDTTSGNNYLGLDDPGNFDQFITGDSFNLNLGGPFNALGLSFITSDPLEAGDIKLQTPLGDILNSAVEESILADGGFVYFLGLVSLDSPFGLAQIRTEPTADVTFLYTVDDIITAKVTEPSTVTLFLMVLLGSFFWQRPNFQFNRG